MKRTEILSITAPVRQEFRYGVQTPVAHLPQDARQQVVESLAEQIRARTNYRVEVESHGSMSVRPAIGSKVRVAVKLTYHGRRQDIAFQLGGGFFTRRQGRRLRKYVVTQEITKATATWTFHLSINIAGFLQALKEELERAIAAEGFEQERRDRERYVEAIAVRFKSLLSAAAHEHRPNVDNVALTTSPHSVPPTFGIEVRFKEEPKAADMLPFLQMFPEASVDVSYHALDLIGLTEQQMEAALAHRMFV